MGMERRQYTRYQISQGIKLSMGHESFFEAESIDISAGGLRCHSAYAMEPLTRVYLMLRLPTAAGERTLQTEASIVHVHRADDAYEYGIQFDPLPQEDRDALNAFLASMS
jgi:c-di-GMP-binding flagellar brake protein YcgR